MKDKVTLTLPRSVAIAILRQLEQQMRPEAEPMKISVQDPDFLNLPLDQLPFVCEGKQLRGRIRAFLENRGHWHALQTIEDLCRAPRFRRFRHVGISIKTVVENALAAKGLKLGMSDADIEYYRRGW